MARADNVTPADKNDVPTTQDELRALLKRAHKGDETTVPVLRKMLDRPGCVGSFGGNLAEQVISSFVKSIGGENVAFREDALRKLAQLRTELLGENPTPVERLLVERVVACWLQVQDAEWRAAQGENAATFQQSEFYQRRMDATNRRFLAAVRTLALVRKLAVPALQINIARKQVNVAAASG